MPRTNHRVAALLLPIVVLFGAACSAGPSDRPAVAYQDSEQQVESPSAPPKPTPVPPLGKPADDTLNWQDCTGRTRSELGDQPLPAGIGFSCSRLLTTLDSPESPARGTARMALLSAGTGTIPLVVANDAGGEPGTHYAARLALRLPPEVLKTFKIIGVDRRGTGQSEPADCIPPAQRDAIVGFDPRAADRPTLDRLVEAVRDSSQQCLLDLDDRLQAYDTWRAASDLEELRIELGVPKLHAIGRGEASRLLTTYSERFPTSVGRMVLDGAPDPMLDVIAQSEAQAGSAEETFNAFATNCGNACSLGPDPRKTVSDLVERTRTTPLNGGGTPVTAGKIVRATLRGVADPSSWPTLEKALSAANNGDGSGIAALTAPLSAGTADDPARLDADLITSCNDTTVRVPPERATTLAQEWNQKFPLFGGIFAQRTVWCSLWPVPQETPPPPGVPGLPPIPVIGTAHDPLIPALGSEHMAKQLPSGIAVNWQGTGHGAIGRSPCITQAISRFLVQGSVPPAAMACPA